LSVLLNDVNYFTGVELAKELIENKREDLSAGFRLCPKMPFVMGGEYKLDNLYLKLFDKNLSYNAAIARQVICLEDGQKVQLKIQNLD